MVAEPICAPATLIFHLVDLQRAYWKTGFALKREWWFFFNLGCNTLDWRGVSATYPELFYRLLYRDFSDCALVISGGQLEEHWHGATTIWCKHFPSSSTSSSRGYTAGSSSRQGCSFYDDSYSSRCSKLDIRCFFWETFCRLVKADFKTTGFWLCQSRARSASL